MKTLKCFMGKLYGETISCQARVFRSSTSILLTILSIYLGLIPQLIGVAPEKAIKLTVSFFLVKFMSFV